MGEERYLYFIEFRDQKGDNKKMAIYDVDNIDECSRVFREYEGEKAVIKIWSGCQNQNTKRGFKNEYPIDEVTD